MFANILSCALIMGYASAQCRSMRSAGQSSYSTAPAIPLDICYPESYDGETYVYTQFKCVTTNNGLSYTVQKYTYSDSACSLGQAASYYDIYGNYNYYATSCYESNECYCGVQYDLCDYASYVTYDMCSFPVMYDNGGAVVINECMPYSYTYYSSFSFITRCPDISLPVYPDVSSYYYNYQTELYLDDVCNISFTPAPTMPVDPTPEPTPYPWYTYTPAPSYPTIATTEDLNEPCTQFITGCSNYGAASPAFVALSFVIAVLACFLQ